MGVDFAAFSDLLWEQGRPAGPLGPAVDAVVRRKWLARGEGGVFAQYVQMPPGYVVRPHRHSEDELVVVLEGSCRFQGSRDLGPGDSARISAGTEYGFEVGRDGLEFLIVRTGEAVLTRSER